MAADREIIDLSSDMHRSADALRRYAAPVLVPMSWLYQCGSSAVRAVRSIDEHAHDGVTVISVGNIEVGGNGKTPMAMYLLEQLVEAGERPAFVSRGYGSRGSGFVTVLADDRGVAKPRPGVRYVDRRHADLWRVIGDEPAMVAARLPAVPVVVCTNKQSAVDAACELGATHVIVDDAFQTWGLSRDIDIVMLDARRPFGDGRLLPAGTLRESVDALSRADRIVLNGASDSVAIAEKTKEIRRLTGASAPIVGAKREIRIVDAITGEPATTDRPVASLCGIARPAAFEAQLIDAGTALGASFRFNDHHAYTPSDVDRVDRFCRSRGIDTVVTTEKDWVKLGGIVRDAGIRWRVAELRLSMLFEESGSWGVE